MKARLALVLAMALNACTPSTGGQVTRALPISDISLPPIKVFATGTHAGPVRANNDLALDFIELSFKLESGRELPVFTRFEGPVTVTVIGQQPASLQHDLTRLLHRLRTEAQIDIRQINAPRANITINAVPRKEIRKLLPQAACFVAPNVSTLEEYRKTRKSSKSNWSQLRKRERLAIFLPNDVSPQEVRDCLHEELAQSLGPLNDLYRLPDSVFNDDNVHTVLTGFDMLMLRTYYSPRLHNGMSRGQVAATLPHILRDINPRGETASANFATRTPIQWKRAIESALGPASTRGERKKGQTRRCALLARWAGKTSGVHLPIMPWAASCNVKTQPRHINTTLLPRNFMPQLPGHVCIRPMLPRSYPHSPSARALAAKPCV